MLKHKYISNLLYLRRVMISKCNPLTTSEINKNLVKMVEGGKYNYVYSLKTQRREIYFLAQGNGSKDVDQVVIIQITIKKLVLFGSHLLYSSNKMPVI